MRTDRAGQRADPRQQRALQDAEQRTAHQRRDPRGEEHRDRRRESDDIHHLRARHAFHVGDRFREVAALVELEVSQLPRSIQRDDDHGWNDGEAKQGHHLPVRAPLSRRHGAIRNPKPHRHSRRRFKGISH